MYNRRRISTTHWAASFADPNMFELSPAAFIRPDYPGLAPAESMAVHRRDLCSRVGSLLEAQKVILWMAPHAAGKASMSQLLQNAYGWCRCTLSSDPTLEGVPVFRASQPQGGVCLKDVLRLKAAVPTNVLIIEDALLSLQFAADHWFWCAIKSIANLPVPLRVLMFSTYGSPSQALSGVAGGPSVALPRTLGCRDLQFTEAEATDMYNTYKALVGRRGPLLTEPVWLLIQELTGRHPLLLRTALGFIHDFYWRDPYGNEARLPSYASGPLMDDILTSAKVKLFGPGSMLLRHLTAAQRDLIHRIISTKDLQLTTSSDADRAAAAEFLSEGYLMLEGPTDAITAPNQLVLQPLIFALFRRLFSRTHVPSTPTEPLPMLRALLPAMTPGFLREALAVASAGMGRQFQLEVYAALTAVLPATTVVSADVGYYFGANGPIDFYIDSGASQVGIELLRDGRAAYEHLKRLKPDGRFARMATTTSMVLNFRIEGQGSMPGREMFGLSFADVNLEASCETAEVTVALPDGARATERVSVGTSLE